MGRSDKEPNETDEMEPQVKRSHHMEKKEESIIRTYQDPVLPSLTRIIFWIMIVVVLAMLAVDISTYVRYNSYQGWKFLYRNLSITGFWSWGISGVILIILGCIGMWQNRKKFYERKQKSGITDESEADKARSVRAVRRLNRSYLLYTRVAIGGIIFWSLLYLIGYLAI